MINTANKELHSTEKVVFKKDFFNNEVYAGTHYFYLLGKDAVYYKKEVNKTINCDGKLGIQLSMSRADYLKLYHKIAE